MVYKWSISKRYKTSHLDQLLIEKYIYDNRDQVYFPPPSYLFRDSNCNLNFTTPPKNNILPLQRIVIYPYGYLQELEAIPSFNCHFLYHSNNKVVEFVNDPTLATRIRYGKLLSKSKRIRDMYFNKLIH